MNLFELKKPSDIVSKQDKVDQSGQIVDFIDIHYQRINNIKDLMGEIPKKDVLYFLWTMKSFNAFTFITYIIRFHGKIEELTFSTYGINTRIVNALFSWLDKGKIGKINIFMSESATYRIPKVVDLLNSQSNSRNGKVNVFFGWNHSKVTLMKAGENYFVVTGSGNFSENARHEQYNFSNSESLYSFYKNCIMNENS